VVDLGAPPQRLRERLGADRREEELLHVDAVVGVRSAVDDVEQRHGEDMRVGTAEVAEQGEVGRVGGGLRDSERDAQDRVRTGARLVLGAVGLDEDLVDDALLARLDALDRRTELVDDGGDGLQDALAAVPALVAVPKLVRLEGAGGCAGRNGGPLDDPVVEQHLHFDGRVSARVEDLARAYSLDQCH
jgi:hypothetical protein